MKSMYNMPTMVVDRALAAMQKAGLAAKYIEGNGCTQSRCAALVERLEEHYEVPRAARNRPLGARLEAVEIIQNMAAEASSETV